MPSFAIGNALTCRGRHGLLRLHAHPRPVPQHHRNHYSLLRAGFAVAPAAFVAAVVAAVLGKVADRRGHRPPLIVPGARARGWEPRLVPRAKRLCMRLLHLHEGARLSPLLQGVGVGVDVAGARERGAGPAGLKWRGRHRLRRRQQRASARCGPRDRDPGDLHRDAAQPRRGAGPLCSLRLKWIPSPRAASSSSRSARRRLPLGRTASGRRAGRRRDGGASPGTGCPGGGGRAAGRRPPRGRVSAGCPTGFHRCDYLPMFPAACLHAQLAGRCAPRSPRRSSSRWATNLFQSGDCLRRALRRAQRPAAGRAGRRRPDRAVTRRGARRARPAHRRRARSASVRAVRDSRSRPPRQGGVRRHRERRGRNDEPRPRPDDPAAGDSRRPSNPPGSGTPDTVIAVVVVSTPPPRPWRGPGERAGARKMPNRRHVRVLDPGRVDRDGLERAERDADKVLLTADGRSPTRRGGASSASASADRVVLCGRRPGGAWARGSRPGRRAADLVLGGVRRPTREQRRTWEERTTPRSVAFDASHDVEAVDPRPGRLA